MHPDLFSQYPEASKANAEALQSINVLMDAAEVLSGGAGGSDDARAKAKAAERLAQLGRRRIDFFVLADPEDRQSRRDGDGHGDGDGVLKRTVQMHLEPQQRREDFAAQFARILRALDGSEEAAPVADRAQGFEPKVGMFWGQRSRGQERRAGGGAEDRPMPSWAAATKVFDEEDQRSAARAASYHDALHRAGGARRAKAAQQEQRAQRARQVDFDDILRQTSGRGARRTKEEEKRQRGAALAAALRQSRWEGVEAFPFLNTEEAARCADEAIATKMVSELLRAPGGVVVSRGGQDALLSERQKQAAFERLAKALVAFRHDAKVIGRGRSEVWRRRRHQFVLVKGRDALAERVAGRTDADEPVVRVHVGSRAGPRRIRRALLEAVMLRETWDAAGGGGGPPVPHRRGDDFWWEGGESDNAEGGATLAALRRLRTEVFGARE